MNPRGPHDAPHLTAWHVCLVQLIRMLTDSRLVDVRDFDKLGTLPLEADIVLLRKVADLDLAAAVPELDFLLRYLQSYLVVEYKSPEDRLDLADLDVVRAYGLLVKRKYKLAWDREVTIALMYSRAAPAFFSGCAENRYSFTALEPGVQVCEQAPFRIVALDLVALGEARPENTINLVSTRHREFIRSGVDPRRLALVNQLLYLIRQKERVYGMAMRELQGYQELSEDLDEVVRRVIKNSTTEQRLEGLSGEEIVRVMSPEELLRVMSPEQIVQGLSSVEFLRSIGPEALAQLEAALKRVPR